MRSKIVPAAALLAATFSLTACAGNLPSGAHISFKTQEEIVDFLFPDTPGEKETKIEQLASEIRMQPGYQVGKDDGSAVARGYRSVSGPIFYDSPYFAEAVNRVMQRQPVFARNYRRGFLDGYRETYGAGQGQSAYDAGRSVFDGGLPSRTEIEARQNLLDSDPEYERLFLQGRQDALDQIQKNSGGDGYSMGGPGGDGGDGGGG